MVKKILAKTYIYFILFMMYLPMFVLIIFSFTTSTDIGTWSGFSFELYGKLFQNAEIMQALGNTLLVAVSSAVVSTVLGTLGAIGTFYSKRRSQKVIESMNRIPVINAEIVMALSLAVLFVALGCLGNFFTLLVGHVVLTVAFVYLSVKPKLTQMDPNTYEAALDLGASPNVALRKVIIPEIMPGIVSGFMLALTLSLDDFIITLFLRDNSFETLSTYVQGVIARSAIPAELRALTTVVVLFAILLLVLNNLKSKKERKKKHRVDGARR